MTQTIALNGATPEINPLYIKMRRRFAVDGDRTIGEALAQQAIRDGYRPYAAPTRKSNAGERHVTRANSLPAPKKASTHNAQRVSLSGGSVAVMIVLAFLLLVLLFSGLYINNLNNELNNLQNGNVSLSVEDRNMRLIPESVYENEAQLDSASDISTSEIYTDNLLRAFTK